MNRSIVFAVAAAGLFAGCATAPRGLSGRTGKVELAGFEPRRGGHCESSAMLNALAYLGYGVDEADIAGGGGAPAFMFANEGFPFIGSRNERMREDFLEAARIPYRVVRPEGRDGGWGEIADLLGRGLPVLLRVDMRWLPYLYGGKYGPAYMSFGWHVICLYGLDFDAGTALVTDTERGGPCEVALRDLDKARFSATKTYPPLGEYAWVEPRPAGWALDPDALARSALESVLAGYDRPAGWGAVAAGASPDRASGGKGAPLAGLAGLEAFPAALSSLAVTMNPRVLGPAYAYMGDSIERNGTGGSAFRRLFRDFVAARAADCAEPGLREHCAALVPRIEAAAAAWSALADSFYHAAEELGAAGRRGGAALKAAAALAGAATAECARELYEAERSLREALSGIRR